MKDCDLKDHNLNPDPTFKIITIRMIDLKKKLLYFFSFRLYYETVYLNNDKNMLENQKKNLLLSSVLDPDPDVSKISIRIQRPKNHKPQFGSGSSTLIEGY